MKARGILIVAAFLSSSCFGGPFRTPIHEQRLPSGKIVKVVSCMLTWGVEHDERHPDQDAFSIEYLATVPREPMADLEREVVEVFELIRPTAELWNMPLATVTALRTPDHTGTWDVFAFNRSAAGQWTHTSQSISRNQD